MKKIETISVFFFSKQKTKSCEKLGICLIQLKSVDIYRGVYFDSITKQISICGCHRNVFRKTPATTD